MKIDLNLNSINVTFNYRWGKQSNRLLLGAQSETANSPSKLFKLKSTTCTLWSPTPKWKGQIEIITGTILRACHTWSILCLPLKYEVWPPYELNLVKHASCNPKARSFRASLLFTMCSLASTEKITSKHVEIDSEANWERYRIKNLRGHS